jgi:hypothetical protein
MHHDHLLAPLATTRKREYRAAMPEEPSIVVDGVFDDSGGMTETVTTGDQPPEFHGLGPFLMVIVDIGSQQLS